MSSPFFQNVSNYFIGIMSGTSLDGVDAILCTIQANGKCEFVAHVSTDYTPSMRAKFLTLQQVSDNELELEALCANDLAFEYAQAVEQLLELSGLSPEQVAAIGAHGQTIRHQPSNQPRLAYTLQSLNAALLAELTQIHVISDFRSRDLAGGGQGAPLVPAFHAAQFMSDVPLAVLNLGGIGNLTLLQPSQPILGFDTGPANVLLNDWISQHLGVPFDKNGTWARSGEVLPDVLQSMLQEPFFHAPIPKSTGRDLFHMTWLRQHIPHGLKPKPEDIQASLVELCAQSIALQLHHYLPKCSELITCGGGVQNQYLMERIEAHCVELMPTISVSTTKKYQIDPQTVEALAFAWFAWCFTQGLPANLPSVTGAKGPRMLGTFYPK